MLSHSYIYALIQTLIYIQNIHSQRDLTERSRANMALFSLFKQEEADPHHTSLPLTVTPIWMGVNDAGLLTANIRDA